MKRFTECQKWNDPWFRRLEPELKLLWLWIIDNCDCAGILDPDMDLAAFQIGATKPLPSPFEAFGARVRKAGEKLFVTKFVQYQYGDALNPANSAHQGVLKRLEHAGIECPVEILGSTNKQSKSSSKHPESKGLHRGYQAPQDKDKDKDKEEDKEKDARDDDPKPLCTLKQARSHAPACYLTEAESDHWWHTRHASGWMKGSNGGHPVKISSWQSDMRQSVSWIKESMNKSPKASKPKQFIDAP
jgi:hypothetical protein